MLVEGAILDIDGARPAYSRFRNGRLVETGALGTDSTHGRDRKVRGVVIPSPVNSHTHLGDAVSVREPPHEPVSRLVQPPHSYKFRLLAESSDEAKRRAIRSSLQRMMREGIAVTVDFREEGQPGVELFRRAAQEIPLRTVILGRPIARPVDPVELARILSISDGIGLSSARDETTADRQVIARACRRAGKRYALHASEAVRERPEDFLNPRPDLIVHLAKASPDDLRKVCDADVPVVVCPRSNALFGRQPDLATMERLGLKVLLGTDNAMFHAPSIWRELEFAYVSTRLRRRPVSAAFLARSVLVEPWRWLGDPEMARIAPGTPARPLILRLPPEDPAYQVVTRMTEHLIVRGSPRDTASSGE
jgi:cytosine/adenosine deaminase-related metal-dependent hydrolase